MTRVLSINVGSSSVKGALHDVDGDQVEEVTRWSVVCVSDLLDNVAAVDGPAIDIVAHRVVHGGPRLMQPVVVDDSVLAELEAALSFAPLHLPLEIASIRQAMDRMSTIPHVACFDTTFHADMPDVAKRLPLPHSFWDHGIRRYGFHGLSYQHVVDHVGADELGDAVVAHLGSGSSVCAIRNGKSIDTSMGFTPGGGLMMGTRSGDVDPGLISYLLQTGKYDADSLFDVFEKQSGLLGVSGETADMKSLLQRAASNDESASFAIEMYCYIVTKQIGAYAAALGGVKTIVFTGAIGEHAREVRRQILSRLSFLDARVLVVSTDEEAAMARSAAQLVISLELLVLNEERTTG